MAVRQILEFVGFAAPAGIRSTSQYTCGTAGNIDEYAIEEAGAGGCSVSDYWVKIPQPESLRIFAYPLESRC